MRKEFIVATSYKKTGFIEDYAYLLSVRADKAETLWTFLNDSQDDLQRRFLGLLPTGSKEWAFTKSFLIGLVKENVHSVDSFDRTARLLALSYLMLRTEEGSTKLFDLSPKELQSSAPIQWYDSHPLGVDIKARSIFGLFNFSKVEGLRFLELKEILDEFLVDSTLPLGSYKSQHPARVDNFIVRFVEASSTSKLLFTEILDLGSESTTA
jgi:hypothetical protein